MPVEIKPLFRPETLRPRLAAFKIPERVVEQREMLGKWAELLHSPQADRLKEQELLPDFLTDVFTNVLGYSRPTDNPARYLISREKHVQVGGKFADAVLGEFADGREQFLVALEGKGPTDPLDRPFRSRKMSAVDQGYRYAINLPCDWIIVTSMRQTRLYYKGADQLTYERFNIRDLAENDFIFRHFVFLLGADRVVPETGRCHLDELRTASEKAGKELTKEFYVRYANMREDVYEQLCAENPNESRHDVLSATQKVLDRVLFCAFCEDRGLLPDETLAGAFEHRDPYNPRPVWENFRGLFRSIDQGNASLNIPPYNGGLFADDPFLERLTIPDAVCSHFRNIGEYEYGSVTDAAAQFEDEATTGELIDVDILGHIFEQSITDLEQLRNELDGLVPPQGKDKHKTRRKKEGAFYTPAFITRYIVEQALGGVLQDRFETLRKKHADSATGTAVKSLNDPRVYDLDSINTPQRKALTRFWEAWQDELATVRILDPACGSGAFLIEAFDQLHAAYQSSNDRLDELRGHRTLYDLDRRILQDNLYGVDLNAEAIQICRLSLWIKTAQRGKQLTSLDHTIRVGNSVVDDPDVHPQAFDWSTGFPEVTESGGFDVVVGNPPYIRQEWLKQFKAFWEKTFKSYHGTADIYVYFYERGCELLKRGGRLSFVVTNKWLRSSYGEPLRRYFSESVWVESVVDFGHAKQIFEQADVFPSIIVARKPTLDHVLDATTVCTIPREQLRVDNLTEQIRSSGYPIPRSRFTSDSWSLEPPAVDDLLEKLQNCGESLTSYSDIRPLRGILTGLNEAFLIDGSKRKSLVAEHAGAADIIKPYLRGQDISRWYAESPDLWMIAIPSSGDHEWPWSNAGDGAETFFAGQYPSVHRHLKSFEERLIKRGDKGHFWWELRACAYWDAFDRPKLMYQDITWSSKFCLDRDGTLSNNTVYILPTSDWWLLAVLNSPVAWWFSWRKAVHGKDEALRLFTAFIETFPIPAPGPQHIADCEAALDALIKHTREHHSISRLIHDWLKVEFEIEKPGKKLSKPVGLGEDDFIGEVRKRRGRKNPLSAAGLKALRDEHRQTIDPARTTVIEARTLENQISDCVNEAFGLTPEEVDLIWKTAPPRMAIARP